MQRMITVLSVLWAMAATGCRWGGPDEDAMSDSRLPPATAIAPTERTMPLEEKLRRLEAELGAAVGRDRDSDEVIAHLLRAEAITDGLLESEPPFAWTEASYVLEARLRQLQAKADRIIARLRRGSRPEAVAAEVELLRSNAEALRIVLERGDGGAGPPALDSLLATIPAESGRAGTR